MGPGPRGAAFSILSILAGSLAAAAPRISITGPTPGQPLDDVSPTVTVAYASDNPAVPLDLASLRIVVTANSRLVEGTVTASDGAASFVPSSPIAAGALEAEAAIADTSGVTATATASWNVIPTLEALTPNVGAAGDAVTVTALGLDPDPARNVLVFSSLFDRQGISTSLESVDVAAGTGQATVVSGAASGEVRLIVNGQPSAAGRSFKVLTDLPACGSIEDGGQLLALANGSVLAKYTYYWAIQGTGQAGICPVVPAGPTLRSVVVLMRSRELVSLVQDSPSTDPVRGIAVDRTGYRFVVLTGTLTTSKQLTVWRYDGQGILISRAVLELPLMVRNLAADFDPAGNLLLAVLETVTSTSWRVRILAVPAAGLESGGLTAQPVATVLDPAPALTPASGQPYPCAQPLDLAVRCDGAAYLGVQIQCDPADYWRHHDKVYKVDLAAGSVATTLDPLTLPNAYGFLTGLAATCHNDEILGAIDSDPITASATFWQSSADGAPRPIWELPDAYADSKLTVVPNGDIYVEHWSGVVRIPNVVRPCEACPGCQVTAQPVCVPPPTATIKILPSTTRWKAQRSDEPIRVEFSGPNDLDTVRPDAGTLEVTGPAGSMSITGPITLLSSGDTYAYSMQWKGPWTFTDPADGLLKRLPAANYSVRIKARRVNGTESPYSASYDKVSLVEVTRVRFVSSGARIDAADDGSTRIFAESRTPDGPLEDTVDVEVEINPRLENAPDVPDTRERVRVYFASFDVDDTFVGGPVDLDGDRSLYGVADNRGAPREGALAQRSLTLDADQATGRLQFQVSTRQGDNYRVAASTSQAYLEALQPLQPSQTGQILGVPGDGLPTGPQAGGVLSEVLAVWRTVRVPVERFTMDGVKQADLDTSGRWQMVTRFQLIDPRANFLGTYDHTANNDWYGGTVNPCKSLSASEYTIEANNRTIVQTSRLVDMRVTANGCTDQLYYVRDDLLESLQYAYADLSLATDVLKSAYVAVEYEYVPPRHPLVVTAGGTRNLSANDQEAVATLWDANANYWVVPLLLAFDGDVQGDLDPTYEIPAGAILPKGTMGQTTDSLPPVSALFNETLADYYRGRASSNEVSQFFARRKVTAHEIMHAFGLSHDGTYAGGLMCEWSFDRREVNGDKTTDAQLATVRAIEIPIVGPEREACPPSRY